MKGSDNIKKLILFLILILNYSNVFAEEVYYSKYGEFTNWNSNEIFKSDLIFVENENRFKWYYDKIVKGNYFIENKNDKDFSFIDKNDYVENKFSNWNRKKPLDEKNRIIEEKKIYKYRRLKKIRYIHIYDVLGNYGALRFPEVDILVNGKQIKYDVTCINCNSNINKFINNDIFSENNSVIYNGGSVTLDLKNEYNIEDINVNLYLYDVLDNYKKFSVGLSYNLNINNEMVAYRRFSIRFITKPFQTYCIKFPINNTFTYNSLYGDFLESEKVVKKTIYNDVSNYYLYRYKDTLYRYYKKVKTLFSEKYYKEKPEINVVKGESKKFYRSKMRNKVVFDDFVISNKNTVIEDLILNNTFNKEINFSGDINYDKNGIYEVLFEIPDGNSLKRNIKVDIKENDDNLKLQKEILLLKKNNEILKNKNNELDIQNLSLLSRKTVLEEENNKLLNKVNKLLEEKKIFEEDKVKLNQKILFYKNENFKLEENNVELLKKYENVNSKIFLLDSENINLKKQNYILIDNNKFLKNDNYKTVLELKNILEEKNVVVENEKKIKSEINNLKNYYKNIVENKNNMIKKLEIENLKNNENIKNRFYTEINRLKKDKNLLLKEIKYLNEKISNFKSDVKIVNEECECKYDKKDNNVLTDVDVIKHDEKLNYEKDNIIDEKQLRYNNFSFLLVIGIVLIFCITYFFNKIKKNI